MKSRRNESFHNRNRGGVLPLAIILLVVMAAVIWGGYKLMTSSFNPLAPFQKGAADRKSNPGAKPWEEWDLMFGGGVTGGPMAMLDSKIVPYPSQLKLEKMIKYEAEIYEGDDGRGYVEFYIMPDGSASGGWLGGSFYINGAEYKLIREEDEFSVSNAFKGTIAPLKIYEDENGKKQKSWLYFLMEGYTLVQGTGPAMRRDGYLTGWIKKDYQCRGRLWLMSSGMNDEYTTYEWDWVEPTNNPRRVKRD